MKNRLFVLAISLIMVSCGSITSFAETAGDTVTNLDKRYYSDYSSDTVINSSEFNPAEFTIDLVLESAEWLGVMAGGSGSISIRTDGKKINLHEAMPNLDALARAEEAAMTRMAGFTFTCRNQPVSWNGKTGQWETVYTDPAGKIRTALDILGSEYIKTTEPPMRGDDHSGAWFDSYMNIAAGTFLQYGSRAIESSQDIEIDELYDPVMQKDYYASTFAENVLKLQKFQSQDTEDSKAMLVIPAGSFLQFGGYRYTIKKDLIIEFANVELGNTDPLADVLAAINTAAKTNKRYEDTNPEGPFKSNPHSALYNQKNDDHAGKEYFVHTCDVDAVFNSGFALLNEIIGLMAQPDTEIIIGDGVETGYEDIATPAHKLSAEVKVTSAVEAEQPCQHLHTEIIDKEAATIVKMGYTGDTRCLDCGEIIKIGEGIPKLPSSIKLNYSSLKLKTGQSTSAVKVTYKKGDSIKSVTSSNKNIVNAAKSGANGIKLTAGKKTGTAKVTVKLASQKKATITVTVQKGAVACTGIKISGGTTVKLKKGKTHQIKAVRQPVTCVQKITYKSSNKKVATVTKKGKIKAVRKGKATITVKCGKKTKKIKVTVK